MPLARAGAWLLAQPHRQQGEFVLVLGPQTAPRTPEQAEGERILRILLKELPASDAARLAARISGVPRSALYAAALARGAKKREDTG